MIQLNVAFSIYLVILFTKDVCQVRFQAIEVDKPRMEHLRYDFLLVSYHLALMRSFYSEERKEIVPSTT